MLKQRNLTSQTKGKNADGMSVLEYIVGTGIFIIGIILFSL